MATKFTATATDTTRTIARRGVEFPAKVVTCDCAGCNGRSVLVPAATVDSITKQQKLALHNFVAQSRVLGFPAA